jgi:hypothetical protein
LSLVFGLWQLVFGSIFSTGMNIPPKTKDHTLKNGTVFGFFLRNVLRRGRRRCGLKGDHYDNDLKSILNTMTYLFLKGLFAFGAQW